MVYIFIIFIVSFYLLLDYFNFSIIEPGKISLIMWFISAVIIEFGLLDYSNIEIFTLNSFLILIIAIFSFVIGSISLRTQSNRVKMNRVIFDTANSFKISSIFLMIFTIFSSIYILMIFYDLLINQKFNLTILSLKQLYWDDYYSASFSMKKTIISLVRPFSFILAVGFPLIIKNKNKLLILLSSLSIFCISMEDMMKGKRGVAVLILLTIFFFNYLIKFLRNKNKFTFKKIVHDIGKYRLFRNFIFFILIFYIVFGLFPAMKNVDLSSKTVDRWLGYITPGVIVKPIVFYVEEKSIIPNIAAFAFGMQYISNPIPTYTYFFEETDVKDWYLFGSYNLPQFNRLFSQFNNKQSAFLDRRLEIESISIYGNNPFKTGIIDFMIDFSVFGTIIAMFFFGRLSQKLFILAISKQSLELMVAYSLLLSAIFSFPLFSSFYMGIFSNTLIVCILIYFIKPLLSKEGYKNAS